MSQDGNINPSFKFSVHHDHTYPLGDPFSVKQKLHKMQDELNNVHDDTELLKVRHTKLQSQLDTAKHKLVVAEQKVKQFEYLQELLDLDDLSGVGSETRFIDMPIDNPRHRARIPVCYM